MGAIGSEFDGEIRTIVNQHGDAALLCARDDVTAKLEDMVIGGRDAVARLQADLEGRNVPRIERFIEQLRERRNVRDLRRRDEVQAATDRRGDTAVNEASDDNDSEEDELDTKYY
jgi:hypothetical protein